MTLTANIRVPETSGKVGNPECLEDVHGTINLPKMDVSSWWLQAVVLTFLFGFAILGYLAIRIYQESPPVPGRIVSAIGADGLHRGRMFEPARNRFSPTV